MKFERIKPGMTLYSVERGRMGNTTIKTTRIYHAQIVSIDAEKRCAMVSWNGNPAVRYHEGRLKKLREKKPVLIKNICGSARLARKGEVTA